MKSKLSIEKHIVKSNVVKDDDPLTWLYNLTGFKTVFRNITSYHSKIDSELYEVIRTSFKDDYMTIQDWFIKLAKTYDDLIKDCRKKGHYELANSYDKLLNRVYRLLGKVYYQLVVYEHLTFLDIDRFTVWVKDDPVLSTNFMYEGDARNYYNKLLRTNPEVKSSIELRILYIDGRVETLIGKEKK